MNAAGQTGDNPLGRLAFLPCLSMACPLMAFAPALKTWLLVVPAVALLGAAGMRMGGHLLHAQESGPAAMDAGMSPPADTQATPTALPAALARRLGASELQLNAVPSGLPLDIRADMEGNTDLFAFAQRLRGQADSGNVEARWMLSRVYDYCSQYASDPGGYQLDNSVLTGMGERASTAMAAARQRVAARCGGFVASDGLGYPLVFAQRRQAAQGGNLAAEASLLADGQPLQTDEDYRRGLVERVRDSHDPEAYMALAPAMGLRASGDRAMTGMVAGEALSELAWRVAACELGMPCGSDSVLMNSFCANGGICSQDEGQDFTDFVYDAAVSRQGAEKMTEWVEELIGKRKRR